MIYNKTCFALILFRLDCIDVIYNIQSVSERYLDGAYIMLMTLLGNDVTRLSTMLLHRTSYKINDSLLINVVVIVVTTTTVITIITTISTIVDFLTFKIT